MPEEETPCSRPNIGLPPRGLDGCLFSTCDINGVTETERELRKRSEKTRTNRENQ